MAELPAQGYYEPTCTILKLPRCPDQDCAAPKHPLAYNPPIETGLCPGCGGPAALPCGEQTVAATYVGEPA